METVAIREWVDQNDQLQEQMRTMQEQIAALMAAQSVAPAEKKPRKKPD